MLKKLLEKQLLSNLLFQQNQKVPTEKILIIKGEIFYLEKALNLKR